MASIQETYINALLADATYANELIEGAPPDDLTRALSPRMTPIIAKFIGDNFEVASHVETGDVYASGFDATVWRGRAGTAFAGRIYVSMQGTAGLQDFLTDAQLTISGNAGQQIIDMVNWWLRITTPLGQAARQIGRAMDAVTGRLVNAGDVPGAGLVSAAELVNGVEVNGHSLGGYLAAAFTRLLGAQAHVVHTTTFNSAGFALGSETAFAALAQAVGPGYGRDSFPAPGDPAQINAFAMHGLNLTTNALWFSQVGQRIELFNEFSASQIPNHFMYKLTDALALATALEKLDPNITLARANALFEAGSNVVPGSLEGVLDAMRRLILDPNTNALAIGDVSDSALSRKTFHEMLNLLQDSATFNSLAGKVQLATVGSNLATQAKARVDFQSLATLQVLSPFVLNPVGAAGQAALDALWQSSVWSVPYQDWLADKTLGNADKQAGKLTFTDRWIDDRVAMLAQLLLRNEKNISTGLLVQGLSNTDYVDASSGQSISVRRGIPDSGQPIAQIFFGGAGADTRSGQGIADRLYGGSGTDTLNGQGGADWLEGNADNDILNGGDGSDVLLGGAGNDTLDGGLNNDLLLGGTGTDTYTFAPNWGHDTIEDAGGQGAINVAGLGPIDGVGANKVAPYTWQIADARVNYTLVNVDSARNDLYISFSDRTDVITIRNWSPSNNVGITLDQVITTEAPPPADQTITLTDPPGAGGAYADLSGSSLSTLINATPDADQIYAGFGHDQIAGNGGGDRLYGNDGDDRLYAGAVVDIEPAMAAAEIAQVASVGVVLEGGRGEDLLVGSASNWLHGGADRDTLIGGGAVDWVQGDTFNAGFALPGVTVTPNFEYDTAKQKYSYYVTQVSGGAASHYARLGELDVNGAGDVIVTGAGDDVADGELGDDTLSLGEGSDIGVGGAGADTVRGGAGNDLIFGDFNADASTPTGNEPIQLQLNYAGLAGALHANDLLMGEAGDDLIWGNGASDQLYGGAGADRLRGDDAITPGQFHGEDFLDGGADNDELEGGGNNDALFGGEGSDNLWGDFGESNTALIAYHGQDYIDGESGNDQLVGGGNDDALQGGAGNDNLWGDDEQSNLAVSAHGNDELDGGDGDDQLIGGGQNDTLLGGTGNDTLRGDDVVANVAASAHGADVLDGGAGDDYLYGDGGNDTLIGGAGTDVMQGGAGDDTYFLNLGSSPIDAQGFNEAIVDTEGRSTIVLSGVAATSIALGAAGGDLAIAYSSTDQVAVVGGVAGNATYQFDDRSYTRSELIGGFSDTAFSSIDAQGKLHWVGGRNNDMLSSNAGRATLSGGRGNDTLSGSGGNNSYLYSLGDGADRIIDTSAKTDINGTATPNRIVFGEGIGATDLKLSHDSALVLTVGTGPGDVVRIDGFDPNNALGTPAIDSFEFADGSVRSYAQLIGQGFDIGGTAGSEALVGTNVADRIDGGSGDDFLSGGGGNDAYWFESGFGNDVVFDFSNDPLESNLIRISGIALAQVQVSRDESNLYLSVRGTDDRIQLPAWFDDPLLVGADPRRFSVEFDDGSIWSASAIEGGLEHGEASSLNDVWWGSATGDQIDMLAGNDIASGMAGNDTLHGGAGGDDLQGGEGNDVLFGDAGDDDLAGGAGEDILRGGDGNDDLAEGGAGVDLLEGGAGQDLLDTTEGGDILIGGIGNDNFSLPESGMTGELIAFNAGDGADYVFAWSEAGQTNVVSLGGGLGTSSISLTRPVNSSSLVLQLSPSDSIELGQWFDSPQDGSLILQMVSAGGIDIYDFDAVAADFQAALALNPSLANWSAGASLNAHKISTSANLAYGGAIAYRYALDGTLAGLSDAALQSVLATPGIVSTRQTVIVPINGTAGDDMLIGDGAANALFGFGGNDVLDGGASADTMTGGTGNDTYVVDDTSDVVTELAGEGTDLVQSTVTYTLTGNVENLELTGSAPINGTGNTLANLLIGNTADNTLSGGAGADTMAGGAGNDTLDGGAGNDTMVGGAGNDTYVVNVATDVVTELANEGSDTVLSGVTYTLSAAVENLTLTGTSALRGTGNALNNVLTGNSAVNTLTGGLGDDTYVVTTGDITTEAANAGTDTVLSSATWTLATNLENVVLTGTGNINATGNTVANVLTGNPGNNAINGAAGADTMIGGAGNDTYTVDNALDVITEFAGEGTDAVSSGVSYTLSANVENLTLTGTGTFSCHRQRAGQRADRQQRQQHAHRSGGQRHARRRRRQRHDAGRRGQRHLCRQHRHRRRDRARQRRHRHDQSHR